MNAAMLAERSWDPEPIQRPTGLLLEFGTFRYEPRRRQIFDAETPCRIGSRALQLLDVLLESPGRLCSRIFCMTSPRGLRNSKPTVLYSPLIRASTG